MITLKLKDNAIEDATYFPIYNAHNGFPTIAIVEKIQAKDLYSALVGNWSEIFGSMTSALKQSEATNEGDARINKRSLVNAVTEKGNISLDFKSWLAELKLNSEDLQIGFLVQFIPKKDKNLNSTGSGSGVIDLENTNQIICPLQTRFVEKFNEIIAGSEDGKNYVIANASLKPLRFLGEDSSLLNALRQRAVASFETKRSNKKDKIANYRYEGAYIAEQEEGRKLLDGFSPDNNNSYYDMAELDHNAVQRAFNSFRDEVTSFISNWQQTFSPADLNIDTTVRILEALSQSKSLYSDVVSEWNKKIPPDEFLRKRFHDEITDENKSSYDEVIKIYSDTITPLVYDKESSEDEKNKFVSSTFREAIDKIKDRVNVVHDALPNKLNDFISGYLSSSNVFYRFIGQELRQMCSENVIDNLYDFVIFISVNPQKLKRVFLSAAKRYVDTINAKYSEEAIISRAYPTAKKLNDPEYLDSEYHRLERRIRDKADDIYNALISYYAKPDVISSDGGTMQNKINTIGAEYLRLYSISEKQTMNDLQRIVESVDKGLVNATEKQEETFQKERARMFTAQGDIFTNEGQCTSLNTTFNKFIETLNELPKAEEAGEIIGSIRMFDDMAVGVMSDTLIKYEPEMELDDVVDACGRVVELLAQPLVRAHYAIEALNNSLGISYKWFTIAKSFARAYIKLAKLFNNITKYTGVAQERIVELKPENLHVLSSEQLRDLRERLGHMTEESAEDIWGKQENEEVPADTETEPEEPEQELEQESETNPYEGDPESILRQAEEESDDTENDEPLDIDESDKPAEFNREDYQVAEEAPADDDINAAFDFIDI